MVNKKTRWFYKLGIQLIVFVWLFTGWPAFWVGSERVTPEVSQVWASTQEFTATNTWTAPSGTTSSGSS